MIHARQDYQRIQDPAGLIPENEPVFLLRAQDRTAAQTLRFWAQLQDSNDGDQVAAALAREHADAMDAWPVKKLADVPKSQDGPQEGLTLDTIKEYITDAHKRDAALVLVGYKTSKGDEIDYNVQLLGSNGYRELIGESLQLLQNNVVPAEVQAMEDYATARAELLFSWARTVAGEAAARNYSSSLVDTGHGYHQYPDKPDFVVLRNMKVLTENYVVKAPAKTVNSAPKTLAKEAISKALPIGHYIGQLNVGLDNIKTIGVAIEFARNSENPAHY